MDRRWWWGAGALVAVVALVGAAAAWRQARQGEGGATAAALPEGVPGVPPSAYARPRGEKPPNVLLIVWDTVRADRLSVYGNPAPTTPFLEEIAPRSLVFDNAVSPSFWTLPSHVSLFTGLPVSSHGTDASYQWLDDRFVTMAEWYRDHGYDTYAWSSNPNINRGANTIQGFETFHQAFGNNRWREMVEADTKGMLHPQDKTSRPDPNRYKNLSHHKAGPTTLVAFESFLSERTDQQKPFFAFLNFMEAHAYRLPTEESRRAIMDDEERYRKGLTTSNLLKRQTNVMYGRWKDYKPKEKQALLDVYDASIRDLDTYLRTLFQNLSARGVLDDTVVILTSDHGEQFGEHGLYLHNYSVYQTLVHVPLLIHYPKGIPGNRIQIPVSTASVFGTSLELTGLPFPDPAVQAIDRSSLLRWDQRPVVAELSKPCANPDRRERLDREVRDWTATYQALYEGGYKLIQASNDQDELFNLRADPEERTNLVRRKPAVVSELEASLTSWNAAIPRYERTEDDLDAAKKGMEENRDDELMKQLEDLGYVEGGIDDEVDPADLEEAEAEAEAPPAP